MTHHDDHFRDAELGPVIDLLEAERPAPTALELDAIKQRARSRAGRSRRTETMRSRLAILGMLALGMVLSTGGAGLAVSGFASQNGNAAQNQYGTPTPTPTPPTNSTPTPSTTPAGGDTDVLGEEDSGGPGGGGTDNDDTNGGDDTTAQPNRQVESGAQGNGDEQLPFTGFAAIPILIGGVALLTTGLVLRRRTADE
jgi:hypothetical protein